MAPNWGASGTLLCCLLLLVTTQLQVPAARAQGPDPRLANPVVPGQLYVKYRKPQGPTAAAAVAAGRGAVPLAAGRVGVTAATRAGETVAQATQRLKADPAVLEVSPDYWVHATQDTPVMPYTAPADGSSWALERISAGYAWGKLVIGRTHTRICIVDSGVDCGHPDLQVRPVVGSSLTRSACVDGVRYAGGVETKGMAAAADEFGHGTKVAGVVAATGDNQGAAGVMYGGAALYVCRFMDKSGWGYASDALRCLNWCLSKGASISVNSWGANLGKLDIEAWSDAKSPPGVFGDMQELLQSDTVVRTHLFVTASGNDGRQLAPRQSSGTYFFVPAQLQAESILTVGATDINDRLWTVPAKRDASTSGSDAAGGSNYGSTFVDVAAPGVSLLTTRLRTAAEAKKAGTRPVSLVRETGTSFSAALAGGVAGLVLAAQNYSGVENGIDMRDVKDAIVGGADVLPQLTATLPDGQQQIREGRRLNAYNTLSEYFGESVFPRLPLQLAGKKPQPSPPPPRPPPPQVGVEQMAGWLVPLG
ncbi:hypothetical protein COHA_008305 [Chlorella ohadii]|uniref:Peptidase S8/S53 domain-containing protein n=1 Tax=Chlorella ohadii TaxID=2649997 RepID=A0AAD5H3A1_9CHLO|nr:hypothetical protein COHA_008305 [Chlorella ohadii]